MNDPQAASQSKSLDKTRTVVSQLQVVAFEAMSGKGKTFAQMKAGGVGKGKGYEGVLPPLSNTPPAELATAHQVAMNPPDSQRLNSPSAGLCPGPGIGLLNGTADCYDILTVSEVICVHFLETLDLFWVRCSNPFFFFLLSVGFSP